MPPVRAPQKVLQKQQGTLQEEIVHNCLYCKEPRKTKVKKIYGEYTIEATIQNKMKLNKCDAYTVKETQWYKGRKTYVATVRGLAKREENQRGKRRETNPQTNNQSSPISRREKPKEEQN